VGVAEAGAWDYAFIYEILQRHFPELPAQAGPIKRSEARAALVSRYLDNVIAADRKMIAKVFHVLNWTSAELGRTVDALIEQGAVREAPIDGLLGPQLVSTRAVPL